METTVEQKIKPNDELICNNIKPLPGNEVAPPLEENKDYKAEEVYICPCGQEHINVGLKSNYNWINCYRCSTPIPKGDQIHWCHPSRFTIKTT